MEEGVNNKVGKTQTKRKRGSYIIDGEKGEKKERGGSRRRDRGEQLQ